MGQIDKRAADAALISLLGGAVGGFSVPIPADDELPAILAEAGRHSVRAQLFSLFPLREDFTLAFGRVVKRAKDFRAEWDRIRPALDGAKIDYLPLKGMVIRDYYPTPDAREFADYDILIREGDGERVAAVMEALGYERTAGEVHDAYHKEPNFNFEMHRILLTPDRPLAARLSTVWERAIPDPAQGERAYRMTDADFVLHFIAHAYKHFSGGGTGLRTLVDRFYLGRAMGGVMESDEVQGEIRAAGLSDFCALLDRLTEDLFVSGRAPTDAEFALMLEGGTYGTLGTFVENSKKKRGRIGHVLYRAFPPYHTMCALFRILCPLPILLPVCWLLRLFGALLSPKKRRRMKTELGYLSKSRM